MKKLTCYCQYLRFLLIVLWLGWGGIISDAGAQSSLDSLLQLLPKAREDTQKVLLLDNIGWMLKFDKPDSARYFLNQALELSEKIGFRRGAGQAWNDLGVVYDIQGQYEEAKSAYRNALAIREKLGDRKGVASIYNNLANVDDQQGDFLSALEHYKKAMKVSQEIGDSTKIARLFYNMGDLYERMGSYLEAQDYLLKYLIFVERNGDREGAAYAYNIMGNIYYGLLNFQEALQWYHKAYSGFQAIDDQWHMANALHNIASIKADLAEMEMDSMRMEKARLLFDSAIDLARKVVEIRTLIEDDQGLGETYNNLGVFFKDRGSYFEALKNEKAAKADWNQALEYFQTSLEYREKLGDKKGIIEVWNGFGDVYRRRGEYDIALIFTQKYLALALEIEDQRMEQNAYKDLSKIYEETGNYRLAFENRKLYDELRYLRLDEQRVKDFTRRQVLYGDQQKEIEIERQQQRNALLNAELKQGRILRNSLLGGALALLLLAGLLYNRNRIKTKANKELAEKNAIIQKERQRSEELLLNILPAQTAQELKEKGRADARRYESVTVLFSDFKSFTTIAEKMSPESLVAELDECFRAFDAITARHGVEKIKTIGDAYMCVGGIPQPNDTHPSDVVAAALEMLEFMAQRARQRTEAFEMRIGIHTGPVVAGIVGSRKFAYDIWGDTVNLAARMEQNGLPGKINISRDTFERVKTRYRCSSRGKIPAKNKGEVEMFFVDGPADT